MGQEDDQVIKQVVVCITKEAAKVLSKHPKTMRKIWAQQRGREVADALYDILKDVEDRYNLAD
jgi:hypothetical protein